MSPFILSHFSSPSFLPADEGETSNFCFSPMFSPCANYQLSGKATADGPSETEKTGTPCTLHVNRLSAGVTVSACSKAIYYFDSPAETTPSASLSLPSGLHVSHAVFLNGFFFALSEKTSVKRKRKAKSVLECWNAADSSVIFSQEVLDLLSN